MHIELTEGKDKWFYKTSEVYKYCPQCKKTYPKAKKCRKCKIHTLTAYKEREGWLNKNNFQEHLCSCEFGSWHRFCGFWKSKGTICKHIKLALSMINRLK